MRTEEWKFASNTGLGDIYAEIWRPDGQVRGVLQIAHGMAEHIGRYGEFASFLTDQGIAVVMNDHAGHGRSIRKKEHRGYFGARDGWRNVVKDMRCLHQHAIELFPDVPMVLMGHSMGSFMARAYAVLYPQDFKAFIFSGTAGKNPALIPAKLIAKGVLRKNGPIKESLLLQKLSTGGYNQHCSEGRTDSDWLSTDTAAVDAYETDPLCGFAFTAEAMLDLFGVLTFVTGLKWAKQVPQVPVYLFWGEQDPVGANGKGPRQVVSWLRQTGHRQVMFHAYEGRHEMLNERNKLEVYQNVVKFLNHIFK